MTARGFTLLEVVPVGMAMTLFTLLIATACAGRQR